MTTRTLNELQVVTLIASFLQNSTQIPESNRQSAADFLLQYLAHQTQKQETAANAYSSRILLLMVNGTPTKLQNFMSQFETHMMTSPVTE